MRTTRCLLPAALTAAVLFMPGTLRADDIKSQTVRFAPGSSSATLKGSIRGYQSIDYILRARAGQTLSVTLATRHGANYFNVLPPGSEAGLFNGSTGGNEWTGTLPADGEYRVRVYLMRSAARRNETANYTLTVGITGSPAATSAAGPPGDVKVAGTPYHATGKLPCSMGNGTPTQCDFGVIRGKPGHAEVHVTPPGGFKRLLRFSGDRVTAPDAKLKAAKHGDTWSIEVNDFERYQIPEAVIVGG